MHLVTSALPFLRGLFEVTEMANLEEKDTCGITPRRTA